MQFQNPMSLPHFKTLNGSLCLSYVIKSKLNDLVLYILITAWHAMILPSTLFVQEIFSLW